MIDPRIELFAAGFCKAADALRKPHDAPLSKSTMGSTKAVIKLKQVLMLAPKDYRIVWTHPGAIFDQLE